MGRQGGISRFTGTVGDINCYFDYGMEIARLKPEISKEQWEKSDSFRDQRRCATVFGAAAVIAGRMWKGLPAGMRRLGDASAYGRFVGAVRNLTEPDGQVWDAELLKGLDLSFDSLGAHSIRRAGAEFRSVPSRFHRAGSFSQDEMAELDSQSSGFSEPGGGELGGMASGYKLVGVDALMADLDEALGGAAGTMASIYVMAHPFWADGFTHEEPMSEWRGGDTTYTEKANRIRKPIGWKRGKHDKVFLPPMGGVWGAKHDGSGKLCGPLPIPEGFKRPQRRVRVWVHACEVLDTEWSVSNKRFELADGQRQFSNGFVTAWLVVDGDASDVYEVAGRDWRTEWMGEGTYVVFTAIEVQEKRGRHWVRLPWCCKFGVQEVVCLEVGDQGLGARDQGRDGLSASLGSSPELSFETKLDCFGRRVRGEVGYLDDTGGIVIVEGWPLVGREIKVWDLEKLLPPGKLVPLRGRRVRAYGVKEVGEEVAVAAAKDLVQVDFVGVDGVLIEIKRSCVPCLDIKRRDLSESSPLRARLRVGMWLGRDLATYEISLRGSGIARSPFSKAFAMAEAIACANSGQGPPFARSLPSKEVAMAKASRAGP